MSFDAIDLESLRLSQNFGDLAGVKKALLTIPLRKPHKHEFFRTRPTWSFDAPCLKMRGDKKDELFLVSAEILPALPDDVTPIQFTATMTRQDVFLLWPLRLPGRDGRQDQWSQSAFEAATMAGDKWIRMAAKMSLGAYEIFEAVGAFPEPIWPALEWTEILKRAFRDHIIEKLDHPALRELRGEL
jgi:hypothetical protein